MSTEGAAAEFICTEGRRVTFSVLLLRGCGYECDEGGLGDVRNTLVLRSLCVQFISLLGVPQNETNTEDVFFGRVISIVLRGG